MKIENIKPSDIENRSFEIISELLGDRLLPKENEAVIKRVIHTSADLSYADKLYFSEGAVEKMKSALASGASIVTDTAMAYAGINKKRLAALGGQAYCFISDPDVADSARTRGVTRAIAAMEKACTLSQNLIFAIGNAPTALLRIKELYEDGRITPLGVIGVPVGFVNVVESKEQLITTDLPQIVSRGRSGGSNIAAAIVNALLYQI